MIVKEQAINQVLKSLKNGVKRLSNLTCSVGIKNDVTKF